MFEGQKFTLKDHTYTIDVIGPKSTILIREDGKFVHANTEDLTRYLATVA